MIWSDATAPVLDDFEILARDAFAVLPAQCRRLCGNVAFFTQDFPSEDMKTIEGVRG